MFEWFALLGWLALAVLVMSAVEYAVHRWAMHRRCRFLRESFERHAVLHHGRYYRRDFAADPDPAARHLNIELGAGLNVFGLSPLWVPLLFVSVAGGLAFAGVFALHALAWSAVHREMHDPRGRWFARTAAYRYLRAYHHTHHLHPGSNFNALLPLGLDRLLGTYRRPVPPERGKP